MTDDGTVVLSSSTNSGKADWRSRSRSQPRGRMADPEHLVAQRTKQLLLQRMAKAMTEAMAKAMCIYIYKYTKRCILGLAIFDVDVHVRVSPADVDVDRNPPRWWFVEL